ncbi:hypothetical protein YC2023_027991 [Brassica napus]
MIFVSLIMPLSSHGQAQSHVVSVEEAQCHGSEAHNLCLMSIFFEEIFESNFQFQEYNRTFNLFHNSHENLKNKKHERVNIFSRKIVNQNLIPVLMKNRQSK